MISLYNKITEIKEKSDENGELIADLFINSNSHYIAVNPEGDIMLFINFKNPSKYQFTPSKGKFLEVHYDVSFNFKRINNSKNISHDFCLLKLNNQDNENNLYKYFLDLCIELITKLGEQPDIKEIYSFIENTKRLFEQLTIKKNTDEIGLWGELFLIYKSKDLNYIVESWHINKTDRFDFNDSINKLEVKTTKKNERIHHFSLNQLDKLQSSNTLICSIMTSEVGKGISVFELYERILSELDNNVKHVFRDKFFQICGSDLISFNTKFDLGMAKSSCKFYSVSSIPSIDFGSIQSGVTNVEFDSNLQTVKFLDLNNFKSEKLFSLFN